MITPLDAANIINYLYGAQAITVTDNQDAIWCDYINDPAVGCPDHQPADTIAAVRLCIHEWSSQGRSWRIDVARVVAAMRKVRSRRLDAVGNAMEAPDGLDAAQEREWAYVWRRLIGDGKTPEEARESADAAFHIDRKPLIAIEPPPEVAEQIAELKRALGRKPPSTPQPDPDEPEAA